MWVGVGLFWYIVGHSELSHGGVRGDQEGQGHKKVKKKPENVTAGVHSDELSMLAKGRPIWDMWLEATGEDLT